MLSNFFSDITQKEITFGKFQGKSPMFIYDANISGGIFLADYESVLSQVPKEFSIIKLPFNKTMLGIYCIEYIDTDIGPYFEIAIAAIIHPPTGILPGPIKSIYSSLNLNFNAYVLHLPVSTQISYEGGTKILNFPKTLMDISVRNTGDHRIFTLRDPSNLEMVIEVQFKNLKTKHCKQNSKLNKLDISLYINPNDYSNKAVLKLNQVEKGMGLLWPSMNIRYGNHQLATQIKQLNIKQQLHALSTPHCEGVLKLEG